LRWKRRDVKSVNLLANCLAKQNADEAGSQEAILLEDDGTITEATSNNVFIVQNGNLVTRPATNLILNGITRQHVLCLAKLLKIEFQEKLFNRDQLLSAEEVFITGSFAEVLAVTCIDGKKIGNGTIGPVTLKLIDAFDHSKPFNEKLNG
jgi:branched-subunit amino acid aminotransferase/4-amino-4-deoxychorismate lyase